MFTDVLFASLIDHRCLWGGERLFKGFVSVGRQQLANMSYDRDTRIAALRRNQKENFVGAEVKKARRVSDLRNRQKEKRRSVWDQGREGLAELQEEELRAATGERILLYCCPS